MGAPYIFRVSTQDSGIDLLSFLKAYLADVFATKAIKRAIESRCCWINGRVVTYAAARLSAGDTIEFDPIPAHSLPSRPAILFEDAHLLGLNKPAHWVCEEHLIHRWFPTTHLVHRLDKGTTGVLLLAKHAEASHKFQQLFADRKVTKQYLTLVEGACRAESGTIDNYIVLHHRSQGRAVYTCRNRGMPSQRAITQWRLLHKGKKESYLEVCPYTGRTHQIRAHLRALGHPIIGDDQYGAVSSRHRVTRPLLHARYLVCLHPYSMQPLAITAPLPEDFSNILQQIHSI